MALEGLVYYSLGLNRNRIMRSLLPPDLRAFSFVAFQSDVASAYSINLPLLLYAVALENNAQLLHEDCKMYPSGTNEHLAAYLNHYFRDLHDSHPTIAWKLSDVEFTGSIIHFDVSFLTPIRNEREYNGIVFARETSLHDMRGFMASLQKFLPHFERGLDAVKSRSGFTYQRTNLQSFTPSR